MSISIADLRARATSPSGKKAIKYTLVSVISVAVSTVVFNILNGLVRMDAVTANILSVTAGGIPSFWLNRRWAWGKTGKSHVFREHLPFWVMNFAGLALSTWWVAIAENWGLDHLESHAMRTGLNLFATLAAFGALWIGKFIVFNRFMFVHHDGAES
jgi:putative flippase GtrA